MDQGFSSFTKQVKTAFMLVLAVSIFLAQGLQIHSHIDDRVSGPSDHVHQNVVHFDHVQGHAELHPDERAPVKTDKKNLPTNNSLTIMFGILIATQWAYPRSLLLVRSRFTFEPGEVFRQSLGLTPRPRAPPLRN